MIRLRVKLKGVVQGVGFRPFVYNLARGLDLKGFVRNTSSGLTLEVEGPKDKIEKFLLLLNKEKPPLAYVYSQQVEFLEPVGYKDFLILESEKTEERDVLILPDIATCEDCLRELFDPEDRRYMYPFINCTNCGPRFTIVEDLPYDRENTTMKVFPMCSECRREYEDPRDRRFHAQPIACPKCGPWITLFSSGGKLLSEREKALEDTVRALEEGKIVAVKGIGGFHLLCDATNEESVKLLRIRKKRSEKPFAVMFRDIKQLKEFAKPTELEEALLLSPERPIVLIEKGKGIAESVAPSLKRIGAFLPYSPLHHLILHFFPKPVVATSGNLSEEPIVKDNGEALEKLSDLADYILLHNRDIKRRCDDSVVKVVGGVPTPIRRSRGYTPLPLFLPGRLRKKVLAVGGMLKNTFAIGVGDKVFLSQHVGDVENLSTLEVFEENVKDFLHLFKFHPEVIVCDLHPRYETSRWAEEFSEKEGIPLIKIQHHYAHILSCMAENNLKGEVLGVAWDGTGYGTDGTIWGGEFLLCRYGSFERLYYLKTFKLVGGEKAVKEPFRVALSLLFEAFGEEGIEVALKRLNGVNEKKVEGIYRLWKGSLNSPQTSSVGRFFDGIASLLNLKHKVSYEGQAAMMVEDLCDPAEKGVYPFEIREGEIDWRPALLALLEEKDKVKAASRFVNTLACMVSEVVKLTGLERVCLSGGVMQNDYLVSRVKEFLKGDKIKVYTHQRIPPNDGGLALGQVAHLLEI